MRRRDRGSILVIVMVTLVFTATALVAFMQRASTDLLVASRVAVANRLRVDAYSALETTLGVLEDFRQADSGLRSPNEGWGDPLAWAGWTPTDPGHTVEISFQDESGKIPLASAGQNELLNLFEFWGLSQTDAQHLVDVLLQWMHPNAPPPQVAGPSDYDQDPFPYGPPERPMRTYDELAAIDFAKDIFYDQYGRRTDLWWRFYNDFSLFKYNQPNINGANSDVLAGLGQFNDQQMQGISDYMAAKGDYVTAQGKSMGAQWFQDTGQLRNVVGPAGNTGTFGTTIMALRITVTVHEGSQTYRVSAVVAPQGGATTIQTTATDVKKNTGTAQTGETASSTTPTTTAGPTTSPTSAQTSAAAAQNLQFPFTLLEIDENEQIPIAPASPPPSPIESTASFIAPSAIPPHS
jgi:hypothetical protein